MGKIPELRRNSSKVLPILTYHDDIFGEARPGLFNRRGPPIDTTTTLVVYYKTMALCLICRGLLGYRFSQEQMFRDDIYTEDKKWVKFKRKRRVIFMEARELEAKDFKNKNIDHWVSLYRLMWYDPAEEKLVISGIGHYDSRAKSNAAAKNYSKAVIGSAKRATKAEREHFTIAYDTNAFLQSSNNWSARDLDWRQLPFPIHMGCWKLALWELGPSIENNNLELFAAIVLRNFAFTHYCREHHDDAERKLDPYRITRVQEVIARSCDSGHKKRREAADRKRQPFTPSYSKAILNLPVELLHLILDLLEYREIKKLEFALGTFSVADSRYWRQRASRNLLEMDEVALLPDVDWRYLCMALERIRGGDDFEARHRVLGILRGEIKPIVLQNLKEREVPSLEEIVDQVREMGVQMWEDEF